MHTQLHSFPDWVSATGISKLFLADIEKYWPDPQRSTRLALARKAITTAIVNECHSLPVHVRRHDYVNAFYGLTRQEYQALPINAVDAVVLNQELQARGLAFVWCGDTEPDPHQNVLGILIAYATADAKLHAKFLEQTVTVIAELERRKHEKNSKEPLTPQECELP